jgi:hypothetical protein
MARPAFNLVQANLRCAIFDLCPAIRSNVIYSTMNGWVVLCLIRLDVEWTARLGNSVKQFDALTQLRIPHAERDIYQIVP